MAVVVAGGGISGLTAARHLGRAGVDVLLVDPGGLGGKIRTSTFAGRRVDEGADAFLIRVPAARDLAVAVGLGPELVHPVARQAQVWSRGALRPLPPHLLGVPIDVGAVAASGILSEAGVAELRADVGRTTAPERTDTDAAIAAALVPRLGGETVARLVDPLVGGINAGSTATQSLAAVAPQLDRAHRDGAHASLVTACGAQVEAARAAGADPAAPIFAAPRGGMARLTDAVAAELVATGLVEIRPGVGVAAVHPGPLVVLTDGTEIVAEGLVVATPAPAAASMLASLCPAAAEVLGRIEHASTAFVRLAISPDALPGPLVGSGALIPQVEGLTVTACSWASNKWAELAPDAIEGTVVVRAAIGRDGDPVARHLDDDAIVDRVVSDLGTLVGLRDVPDEIDVIRWPGAFPQYRPGHLTRITAAEGALAAAAPAVALAGMPLRGVGIPACIASATNAATRVLDHRRQNS